MKHFIVQVVTKNGQQHALWFKTEESSNATLKKLYDGAGNDVLLEDHYGHKVIVGKEISSVYFSDVALDQQAFSDAGLLSQQADRIHKARLEDEMRQHQAQLSRALK